MAYEKTSFTFIVIVTNFVIINVKFMSAKSSLGRMID